MRHHTGHQPSRGLDESVPAHETYHLYGIDSAGVLNKTTCVKNVIKNAYVQQRL